MMDADAANEQLESIGDFEIVGLHCGSNNQSCCIHGVCGKFVRENDLLRLVSRVVHVRDKEPEEAISLVKIEGGTHICNVGFIPPSFLNLPRIKNKVGSAAVVLELYSTLENAFMRRLSNKNLGMASCRFIDDIPNNFE
jgi:hypothetical protein